MAPSPRPNDELTEGLALVLLPYMGASMDMSRLVAKKVLAYLKKREQAVKP